MARRKPSKTKTTKWRKPRYAQRRKVCSFCAGKVDTADYKDADKLRIFITDRAKIAPRRRTGTCARHQRTLATAIKRARHLALLPYVPAHMHRVAAVGIGG
ncbi:MAG: 30S ribosomal protein S18 [Dehalococcoidales bacterium]|nr:30S ribosomal protein S18 [Dehalococcoidales bacterium]MDP7524760.1 30S ribosomal protein S18 [Dehalococcoidales bacterium]